MTAAQSILIVEDDEVTAELERRVLTRAGRTTRTVNRVSDAVELLRDNAFGVVLLDYHLPDGDPWSVVEIAQARVPRVPVIVVTAAGNERIAAEALHHGVSEYVQKTESFWTQLPALVDRVAKNAQSEERVRRGDALFQLIAESASDLVASADLTGVIKDVSSACRTMLGYEPEELVGRTAWHFVHPDDRKRVAAAFESQTHLRLTYRHLKKDGSPLWVEANASVVQDPTTGKPREVVGIIRDVHERKRAEDKFRAFLEGSPEANVIVDRTGDIVQVNTRAERLFGYTRDELLGRPFEVLIAERARAQGPGLDLAGVTGPLEMGARRKDGSEFPSQISVNRLENDGELLVSSTILDISDRKTLQDQHMLLRLGEQLPQFEDVSSLAQHVVSELAAYFDVFRCSFVEIDVERDVSTVLGEFLKRGPEFLGEHPLSAFVPAIRRELEAGRVLSISDMATDLRTADVYETRYAPIEVRAMAGVPLMRKGVWAAVFFVMSEHVRHWTAREIQMLQALVERTWLWMEHVRMLRALRASERKFRHFIESSHEGVWEIDTETRTRFANPRMAEMLGYSVDEMLGKTLIEFMDDEGRALLAAQVERRKQGISESHDSKFVRKDGAALWVRIETNPLVSDSGKYMGALAMVADITERRQAEQDQKFLLALAEMLTLANDPSIARRSAVERVGQHLHVAHCAFVEFDSELSAAAVHIAWAARPDSSLAGTYPIDVPGPLLRELLQGRSVVVHDARADERTRDIFERILKPHAVEAVLVVPMHKDGRLTAALVLTSERTRSWAQREIALAQTATERTALCVERLQNMAALSDMSKELERRVEARTAELKAALKEKEVLLKEIHHRVKNNLQVISSMLNLQAMHISDPIAQSVFAESQGRVQSIALVHETLYESQDLSSVNFAEYVQTLVTTVLQAQSSPERNITTTIDADGVLLPIGSAIPCGLIINELVTNSLKHAFQKRHSGTIDVSLRVRETEQIVVLVVADDGVGLPADLDPRRVTSLGLDLVYTFAEQLGAEVELQRENGTAFRFVFQITAHH